MESKWIIRGKILYLNRFVAFYLQLDKSPSRVGGVREEEDVVNLIGPGPGCDFAHSGLLSTVRRCPRLAHTTRWYLCPALDITLTASERQSSSAPRSSPIFPLFPSPDDECYRRILLQFRNWKPAHSEHKCFGDVGDVGPRSCYGCCRLPLGRNEYNR